MNDPGDRRARVRAIGLRDESTKREDAERLLGARHLDFGAGARAEASGAGGEWNNSIGGREGRASYKPSPQNALKHKSARKRELSKIITLCVERVRFTLSNITCLTQEQRRRLGSNAAPLPPNPVDRASAERGRHVISEPDVVVTRILHTSTQVTERQPPPLALPLRSINSGGQNGGRVFSSSSGPGERVGDRPRDVRVAHF